LNDSHFTLTLNQKMADHDRFEISCFAEAFGDRDAYPMNHSRQFLGKKISIQLKQYGQTAYIFSGIITELSHKKVDGYNRLLIKGYAPTILLENGLDCQSFENLSLDAIIRQATSEYQSDLLSWDLRPMLKDPLLYTVQYRESDWEFIKRLAVRYGEWFYYNGQQIVFGGTGGKTVELVEEKDVYSYELKMRLVAQKFSYVSYDAKRAQNYTVDSENIPLKWQIINPFQQHAMTASEKIYTKVPLSLYNQSLLEKGTVEVSQAVERQKLKRRHVLFLEAKTNNPNLRLGDIVKLKAWMPKSGLFKGGEVPLEQYKIIEITHYQDLTEGYYNELAGIPVNNTVPEYMDEDALPLCEEQSAIVTDNNDPQGMSRIRVQFAWQKPFNGMTPWIRSITPYAGKGKGMHIVPEIGEEVIVTFENGNAEKPVSLGAMFNGEAKSGHGGKGNYMKGLQTAAGSNLTFNDKEGSMTLADQIPAKLVMDGAGETALDSRDRIIITCGESSIELKKDGKILIKGKEIKIEGEDKIETETKSHTTTGIESVKTISDTIIKKEAPKVTIEAEGQVEIKSGQTIEVASTISNIKGSDSVNLN
jgi:type VI secretion system secreted protein VgrG